MVTKPSAAVTKLLKALPAFRSISCAFDAGAESVGDVADRLGRLAALRAQIEIYERALKDAVIANGAAAFEGRHYRVTLSIFEQSRLDSTAIKAEMKPAWVERFTVTTTITKVAVKARSTRPLAEEAA